ncbi:metallophosphoesterase family protein [Cellulomonas composti]|uniref:Calcineurin-like phosphoesterase domain-containing protein n=1 Tax=Cellulomonas composti TaxID=266130 RepID=A0A511JEP1_9CELL|nr:metallophosphoesterase [Cellulomonas composti]GEL96213.1 hypothetical protein CCO02nite_28710 [Cellulomonas composti]
MDEQAPHTHGGWGVRIVLAILAVVISLGVGVTTATAQASFGPHEARYEMTTNGLVVLDLGPLGTLEIDSPLPAGLGLDIVVEEIPASFTEVDDATTLQALNGDLERYVQLFSAPQATVEQVTKALVADALGRAALMLVVLVAGWWLGRLLLGATRRAELANALALHRWRVGVALGLALLLGLLSSSLDPSARPQEVRVASSVFDGSALEGARVTGRLGGVIDTYGAQALAAYRENQEFYAAADKALGQAWDERLTAQPLPTRTPDAADLVTVVVVSDLHCNVGMAPLVTTLVERADAQAVLDAGDTTMNGTGVEQYCVSTFADAIPDGVELVTSPGNHDSEETSAKYAAAGATVLAGKVVDVDGIRVLGDSDPNQTRAGQGTASRGESAQDAGERLEQVACDDEDGVDLLLIHTPDVGTAALESDCVPAQVSGHLHRRYDARQVGLGIRYISSSTAGATLGEATIGPLHGTAELTVLRWDPDRRRFLDYRVVAVHPDTSVDVGPRRPWPVIVVPPTTRPPAGTGGPNLPT